MNTTEDLLINYLLAVIEGVVALDLNSVAQGLQQCRINFQTWNGVSALTLAINSDKIGIPVLKMILDAGFELNGVVTDGKGHTLIMKALLLGVSCDKIRYLVERGADIKFTSPEGNALHFAVKGGNIETLEFLLNYGIDVNDRSNGMSPIDLAVEEYRFKVLGYLLKQKIQLPIVNSTPEHKISHSLHCVAIRKLIADGWTAKFYDDMVDLLCDSGVDVNEKEGNYSALTYSIMARKHQATLKLLERGAKVNDIDVFSACEGKMLLVLNKLIEHGANVKALSKKGRTTVHAVLANPSVKSGPVVTFLPRDPQVIEQMISILAQHGVDFNHIDDDGVVPLMLAEDAVQFRMLEKYGANPNIKINGENLLHLLLENQKIDVYSCAAQKLRGLVNEKDRDGLTPLLLCLTTLRSDRKYNYLASYVDFVRVLIENGADIDVVDKKNGRSAIFYAIYSSDVELVELLLNHGASLTIRDKKGNNILHEVASTNEAEQIFTVLVKYASRELILELLNGKNKQNDYPEDVAKEKGMAYLFKEKIILASRRGVNIFEFEKLFPAQIAKLCNGFQLQQAEISHECMIDLQPVDSFLHLPHEVVLAIMKFSTVQTVVALSTTCRQLKIWSDDNTLWRELLTRKYDMCQSVIKCQNVKQELAKRWNADVNMRDGTLLFASVLKLINLLGEYFINRIKDEGARYYSADYDAEHQLLAYISSEKLVVMDMSTMKKLFEVSSSNTDWELFHPRVRIFAEQKQIICSFGERVIFINLETGLEEDFPGLPKSNDFYSDGDLVAFEIDSNGAIQVWNWVTKTILLELKAPEYWDGSHYKLILVNGKLARMIGQAQVDICDVNTGKWLLEVEGRTIERLDKYIIVGDYDITRPRIYYDTETGREIIRKKFTVEDTKTKMIATLDKELVTVYQYDSFEDHFDNMKIVATKRISRCDKIGALHENLLFAFVHDEIEVYEAHSLHKLYSTKDLYCGSYPAMTVRDHFLLVNVSGALAILNFNL